jgi:predicted oxidoreductase
LRLRPMIWSPLAGGRLFSGEDAQAVQVRQTLAEVAGELGCSPASVAYAWLLRHPSRPHPITGSGRIEAIRDAVHALDVALPAQAWHAIWSAGAGQEVP